MGSDIHIHIEIRYKGTWEHYSVVKGIRWYDLFGAMAGVRGDGPPIVEPKGVPEDMSVVTRLDWERWVEDAHSASWYNEEELDLIQDWLDKQKKNADDNKEQYPMFRFDLECGVLNWTHLFGNSLTAFKHYHDTKYVPDGVDAVRMVFWFDD